MIDSNKLIEEYRQYIEFKKSDLYDEQYKFDFFENNQIDLSKSDNFIEDFKKIRSASINLIPRAIRDNLLIHVASEDPDFIKNSFDKLYDENIDLVLRVNTFKNEIEHFLENSNSWRNKDLGKLGFGTISFLLALKDYKRYLFINPVTPFNNFINEFELDKNLFKKANNGERYKNWLELASNELLPSIKNIDSSATLLTVQDFIYSIFGGYDKHLESNISELDNKQLREDLNKILEIQEVFIKARKDDGQTFLDEIHKLDRSILNDQLDYYGDDVKKVNKVRSEIIKSVLKGETVSLENVDDLMEQVAANYEKDIFKSWGYFSILYNIFYFDKKNFVKESLEKINKFIVKKLGLQKKVKINIVDFNGAQNFGLTGFWTAIFNDTHKSQRTALQLNISTLGKTNNPVEKNNFEIGLGNGPDYQGEVNGRNELIHIDDISYEKIIEIFESQKQYILADDLNVNDQDESILIPIETKQDLAENILYLHHKLNNGTQAEKEFLNGLIRRGRNLVVYNDKNNNIHFAPSRFIGYKNASIERYKYNQGDGKVTNVAISKILGKLMEDEDIKKLYFEYCNNSNIFFGKFWLFEEFLDIESPINSNSYWIYNPGHNAGYWDELYDEGIIGIDFEYLGDLRKYSNHDEIKTQISEYTGKSNPYNDALACEDFLRNMKIGDIVIPKKGKKYYLGYGIVSGEYEYFSDRNYFKNIRKVDWIKRGKWEEDNGDIVTKTLTDITRYEDYVNKLKKLIGIDIEALESNNTKINRIMNKTTNLLDNKKQIILYGPPGTGKTYSIERIIEDHSGENFDKIKEENRVDFITFHQSFSYEEFIEGIKPNIEGESEDISYEIKSGVFKEVVHKAKKKEVYSDNFEKVYNELLADIEKEGSIVLETLVRTKEFTIYKNSKGNLRFHANTEKAYLGVLKKETIKYFLNTGEVLDWPSYIKAVGQYLIDNYGYEQNSQDVTKNYYLVIDEINRGNISKIFGELITLLEADKRLGKENELTAKLPYSKDDFGIPPNLFIIATMNTSDKSIVSLDTALRRRFGFIQMLPDYNLELLQQNVSGIKLSNLLLKLNLRIEYLIDKDHLIGHSYFLKVENLEGLKLVMYNEIIPLLEEYFYGEEDKLRLVLGEKFFIKKNYDKNLFENKDEYDEEEQFEINTKLSSEDFIQALQNIIGPNEQ